MVEKKNEQVMHLGLKPTFNTLNLKHRIFRCLLAIRNII